MSGIFLSKSWSKVRLADQSSSRNWEAARVAVSCHDPRQEVQDAWLLHCCLLLPTVAVF